MKETFLDAEGIPRDAKVLYAFTPHVNVDRQKKFVYKCGISSRFDRRLEAYYTSLPFGVIPLQILVLPDSVTRKQLGQYEKMLFYLLEKPDEKTEAAIQLHSNSRVRKANEDGGITEWFYSSEKRLDWAFDSLYKIIEAEHEQELKAINFDFGKWRKENYKKLKSRPNIRIGQYLVDLGIKFI